MHKSNIVCCYYPTTVVFVDDNRSYLDNVLLELDENISSASFTNPLAAIEYLKKHVISPFENKYLTSLKDNKNFDELDYVDVEHGYVGVDLFKIHKEVYNSYRFNDTVVVVVDYTMPQMNGLEMCQALVDLPLKFVLLTGDAASDKAVEAFNDGIIHQFIQKNSEDFIVRLQRIIHDLQQRQFEELSAIVVKSLAAGTSSSLNDPILIGFIDNFFKANNVVEYYLINESSGFLMLDADGNLSWLIIKNEEEMTEYTNAAADNYGDDKLVAELRNREKILFLFSEKDHVEISVDKWGEYLYPATKFLGKNGMYYYSHIRGQAASGVAVENIVSYRNFLAARSM